LKSSNEEEIRHFTQGAEEVNAGRCEDAIEPLERAMDLNQKAGPQGEAMDTDQILFALGLAYLGASRYPEANFCFAKHREFCHLDGDKEGEMNSLSQLAHSQLEAAKASGDQEGFAAAASCFHGQLELASEIEDWKAVIEALINGSHCLMKSGDRGDETLEYLEVTLEFLEKNRELLDDAEHTLIGSRLKLGTCLSDRDEPERALDPFRRAAEAEQKRNGTCNCRLRALRGLVDALEQLNDWSAFERYLREALVECQKTGPAEEPTFSARLGIALAAQGDVGGGMRQIDKVLQRAEEKAAVDPAKEEDVGMALGLKGVILNNWTKRFSTAVPLLERSIEIGRRFDQGSLLCNRLILLGTTHLNIGSRGSLLKAVVLLGQALELAEKREEHNSVAVAHLRLGSVYQHLNEAGAAISHYDSAIAIYRSSGNYKGLVSTLRMLAEVEGLAPGKAAAYLAEAAAVSKRVIDPGSEAHALRELSRVQRAAGLDQEAAASQRRGLEIVESSRARLAVSTDRAVLLDAHSALYAEAALLAHARGEPRRAFELAEASRARLLLDQRIQQSKGDALHPQLRERRRAMAAEIGAKGRELEALGRKWLDSRRNESDLDHEELDLEIERAEAELGGLEAAWERVEAELASAGPRFATRLHSGIDSVWTVPRVQERLLDEDSVLLEYLLGEDGCLLFCITSEEFAAIELKVRPEQIEPMVDQLCAALLRRDPAYPHGHTLYRALVDPAAHLLAGKRNVLIASSGPLHRLPFAVLLSEDPNVGAEEEPFYADRWSQLPYFLNDRDIRYIASATTDGLLRQAEQAESPAYENELLALSAPLLSSAEPSTDLAPLKYAKQELEAVAEEFAPQTRSHRQAPPLAEEAAKSEAIELLDGSSCRFIHLATHALIDDRSPWLSALVFEPEPGTPSPSFLHAKEAIDLNLDAECMTLSGCQTLGDQISAGEGILGLGLAFRDAGARSTCASRWSIADDSTMLLMRHFYSALTTSQPPAAALAQAQRSLIAESYHPFYWAAFGIFS
jgi:CHAT domain-containing protein